MVTITSLRARMIPSEERVSLTVGLGDVVDELHNEHSLADTSAAKETNLASSLVRGQQVHHLRRETRVITF